MPQAAKKICPVPRCNKVIEHKAKDCGDHPEIGHQGRANPNRDVYDGVRWRRLAGQHKKEFPLCAMCLKKEIYTPVYCTDHIHSINQGGDAYAWENLQSLCRPHHESKSSKEGKL